MLQILHSSNHVNLRPSPIDLHNLRLHKVIKPFTNSKTTETPRRLIKKTNLFMYLLLLLLVFLEKELREFAFLKARSKISLRILKMTKVKL